MARGRHLETLILASQAPAVLLTQVPQAARPGLGTGRGRPTFVAVPGPADFFGCYLDSGRLLVLDAKECGEARRLVTSVDHLPEHQRLQLIRYGEVGAVSGLLALRTLGDELFWVSWRRLTTRRPSIPWNDVYFVGSAKLAIDWRRIRSCANDEAIRR